ncbi:MAG TPA: 5-oxoprolinase subunit PxpB [Candidatus Krumholzibacteria bacterium]|nr:5-oxoprolinase subunit PxpB [Candidatus Krumholzibacteria bacterium]
MTSHNVVYQPASDRSLMVRFGDAIALEIHQCVRALLTLLAAAPVDGVRNLQPGYTTLLITFDPLLLDHATLETMVRSYVDRMDAVQLPPARRVEIPVCYGGDFGPDLLDVAKLHGITTEEVIRVHSSASYLVHFIGFVPGFAYLAGLPESIATPRLPEPRWSIPPGSIGIAGKQTGVYPVRTPAGWRLIGRTPLELFSPQRENMALLSMGDEVRFVPISRDEFTEYSSP